MVSEEDDGDDRGVELFSSPGDEGSLSMLKKAVTYPSVLAPGAPGVSNGDWWDCLVSRLSRPETRQQASDR